MGDNTVIVVGGSQGKGDKGDPGAPGESYVNNGSTDLNVQTLQIKDIETVNIADIPNGAISLNTNKNQLVIKQNNQWEPLNMNASNFEIQTTYKNNTGTFPVNFAPEAFSLSKDAKTDATGLISGYVSPIALKFLSTPTTLLIRVDFKIALTDTTESCFYFCRRG